VAVVVSFIQMMGCAVDDSWDNTLRMDCDSMEDALVAALCDLQTLLAGWVGRLRMIRLAGTAFSLSGLVRSGNFEENAAIEGGERRAYLINDPFADGLSAQAAVS